MAADAALAASPPVAAHRPWLRAVLAEERRAWVFVAKSVLAIYLAGWLAMWLQLEQPATAMITVSLVMHPHSGMVLAKSFYRALGTLAGSLCGLALLALFPQQRELFLLSLSLWVALCAGGATLYRNFMSYGFVLAGYTAAIVALPAINDPLGVFDSAVMRVSEVMLGIAVAAIVSDLLLPERLRLVLRQAAYAQFAQFIDFVRESGDGAMPHARIGQAHLAFVRAAVALEDLRASVIFEDPEARVRSARLRLLNQRYMAAATSFQSLHQLVGRLMRDGRAEAAQALIEQYRPLVAALEVPTAQRHAPDVLAPRLDEVVRQLPDQAARARGAFEEGVGRFDVDTGAVLLQRFAVELRDFVLAEASLRVPALRGSVERVHFRRGNDLAGAGVAVLRTFLTIAGLSAFWMASAWTFGASAMLLATIFSGLLAASPRPVSAALNTLYGYAAGMLAAFVVTFALLPGSDGFAMLIAASAWGLLIGPYLTTRATLPGVGAGYTLGFVYILALKNPMVYDVEHFLNDGVAQLAGLGLAAAAFLLVPRVTGSGWQRSRQLARLRAQVALATDAPLDGLAWRFESVSRDLFLQIVDHTRAGSDASRALLAWALAVQETGRAAIELRRTLRDAAVPDASRADAADALRAIGALYRQPDAARWQAAEGAVRAAIAAAEVAAVRVHLYQLLGALRDEASPLAPYLSSDVPESTHAA